jgi:tRNA pseudouridine38-40 synthase
MRNLKLTISYEGTAFAGWQIQPDQRTIQREIELVLSKIEGTAVKIVGSGRTDAGVHALGQVASFQLKNPIPLYNLRKAVNCRLPPAIRILTVEEAPPDFHARHSAIAKIYEYRWWRDEVCPPFERRHIWHHPYPLNEAAMIHAAPLFEGEHDFRSMATNNGGGVLSTVRTIYSSKLERVGPRLIYRVRGSGFLYNMVRNIVGTLIQVGKGRISVDSIESVLAARNRRAAGPTAPAVGLFLIEVEYGAPTEESPD